MQTACTKPILHAILWVTALIRVLHDGHLRRCGVQGVRLTCRVSRALHLAILRPPEPKVASVVSHKFVYTISVAELLDWFLD